MHNIEIIAYCEEEVKNQIKQIFTLAETFFFISQ